MHGLWAIISRGALATVFIAAAAGKARQLPAFTTYLSVLFGSRARLVAVATIALETGIAISLLPVQSAPIAGATAIGFLGGATLVIAVRLSVEGETSCGCWGATRPERYTDLGYAQMARPAWYATRNGLLALLVGAASGLVGSQLTTAILLFGAPLVLILVALAVSIYHERVKLRAHEHPRRSVFAPHLAPLLALYWYADEQAMNGGGDDPSRRRQIDQSTNSP